mmetsp:Transcript_139319/g.445469  ORF Transcript_139319/g.445469 Transcript_139319/m.445469 type:complete len:305 (+) Transcript_139319:39-953(+)
MAFEGPPPAHLCCIGEWACGQQKLTIAKRGWYLILEMGPGSPTRYMVPTSGLNEEVWPMQWAATKNTAALGDAAPPKEDTLYILELPARGSSSLTVRRPDSDRGVQFTSVSAASASGAFPAAAPGPPPPAAAFPGQPVPAFSSQSLPAFPGQPMPAAARPRSRSPHGGRDNNSGGGLGNWVPGDWSCPFCGQHNFRKKVACSNCESPKPGTSLDDWQCPKCGANNYRHRVNCHGCATLKPGSHANPEAELHESLVSQIKERQRKDRDFKARYHDFCDRHGGGRYDPVRHDARTLKQFMDSEGGH